MTSLADILLLAATFALPVLGTVAVLFARFNASQGRHCGQLVFYSCLFVVVTVTLLAICRGMETWLISCTTVALMSIGASDPRMAKLMIDVAIFHTTKLG